MGLVEGTFQLMKRLRGALAGAALLSVLSTTVTPVGAQEAVEPVETDEELVLSLDGHGWGHGRGMGQFGSLGYAIDFGWSSEQILDHYYGDTTAGVQPNSLLTVRIDAANDDPTVVQVDSGSVVLIDENDEVTHVSDGQAMRLTAVDGGFVLADAPTCAGPFVDRPGVVAAEQLRISTVDGSPTAPTASISEIPDGTIVLGDWNGDGTDTVAIVDGTTWTLFDGNGNNPAASLRTTFEMPLGIALSGDWDGDGVDTAAVFDDGIWTLGNGEATATRLSFGDPGDMPIGGDWDGDGNDDLGVWRDRTWFLSPGAGAPIQDFRFGFANDEVFVGDWDGDGFDDVGLVRQGELIRRPGRADRGTALPRVELPANGEFHIGDFNGDGVDEAILGLAADIGVGEPFEQATEQVELTPRLDPFLPLDETIQRCVSLSEQRYYRGELRAVNNDGNQRTVNAVPVEAYLRAVVPLEMPASWALLGDGAGAAAVQSQAVSARSYALGENRTSYARTCDTISCQVYGGRAVRRSGVITDNEHPLSTEAIDATTGVVRMRDGNVARTEFSSSTGGWTAGGVFPAVEDLGDAVDRNPNHDWTEEIPVSDLEARYGGRQLDRAFISERNGLGEDGGRVIEVTLIFGDETFLVDGNDFRRSFGLLSDWFTVDFEREAIETEVLGDQEVPSGRERAPIDSCICPDLWPDPDFLASLEATP